MEFARGTVKKYSREYTRTLKNGKKKKYKTEQVQITVPKSENIFEDGEDVVILRCSDFKDIEDNYEMIIALELFNSILSEDNSILLSKLRNNESIIEEFKSQLSDSNLKDDITKLNEELDSKNLIITELNDKVNCFEEELESKELLISNLKDDLSLLNKQLEEYPKNSNSDLSKEDYIALQNEFIKISKKLEISQEELFNAKVNALYHRNLANKCKKFILNLE